MCRVEIIAAAHRGPGCWRNPLGPADLPPPPAPTPVFARVFHRITVTNSRVPVIRRPDLITKSSTTTHHYFTRPH
ncbi:hypothetical protein, partial [Streptomyces anatolicus]|uniref:hypothetical protein n=1 Tax=Streptomyces anatolicus TaxID=2675858 RepID=UPI001CA52050